MTDSYKHRSFMKCLGTMYFINRPVYAVKISEETEETSETYALYSKRQFRNLKHKPKLDHIDRIENDNLFQVMWWAVREYVWGWKLQLATEVECGCRTWRGKRVGVYCSSEHMFEGLE